jgi:hypothetical protein
MTPWDRMTESSAYSLCGPPAAGSMKMYISAPSVFAGTCIPSIAAMLPPAARGGGAASAAPAGCSQPSKTWSTSAARNACFIESNASPESSDWMRSGRSCMIVFSRTWRSDDCHRGTRCSMCTQSTALPSARHALHASCTLRHVKMDWFVLGSTIFISRV